MLPPRPPDQPQEEARRARILHGAMTVFLAYGFQRTTMEDIARSAEISRPALYLLFRNKTDIYRALAREFLRNFIETARAALAGEGPLRHRVTQAMDCNLAGILELEKTPHGTEMLDMRNSLASDIMAEGRVGMHALFVEAIEREAARRGFAATDAGLVADLILDAFDGLKRRNPPPAAQQAALRRYIEIALRDFEA